MPLPLRHGDQAWIALALGIIGYEVFAREGELMSEAADRYMVHHPWITRTVAFVVAAHVTNAVPDAFDPLHWLFTAKQHLRREAS